MADSNIERLQIRFETADPGDVESARDGKDAMEHAVNQLQREGIEIDSEERLVPGGPGSRGPIEEFIIDVAASAVWTLLSLLVTSLFRKVHRPTHVTLQSGSERVQFDVHDTLEMIRDRIRSWIPTGILPGKDITVRLD